MSETTTSKKMMLGSLLNCTFIISHWAGTQPLLATFSSSVKLELELNDLWMSRKAKNTLIISFAYSSAIFYGGAYHVYNAMCTGKLKKKT